MKSLKNTKRKLKNTLTPYIVNYKNYKIANNHYIFADPRGGSTWLMEIIKSITNEPIIWEPLHLNKKQNPFKSLNFDWRQYIPEHEKWNEAHNVFAQLFTGKILTQDILKHNSFYNIFYSKSLLFKICRGSALLPWLCNNFQFNYKPIYLLRHPFAVVSSQLRHGAWNYDYSEFKLPNTPYNTIYKTHESYLKSLKTKEENLVAMWCISNMIPLSSPNNNKKWITLTYEDLVLNPEKSIKRILNAWDVKYNLNSINFKQNSFTTKADSPLETTKRLSHWKTHLSPEQLQNMGKVLEYFKITLYTSSNPLPEYSFE
ncbi:sulfotransferase domain-containing protein [Aestuariibaculum sp. M13]|uniref:sulfotransferase domain-containing protein n=1 Tax=Aestuariibaculum sp. M13 TaxID=2967132 RepID=UPI002159CFB9|nr:sulfotransferase domain-containing protein [Aestuariibaculum sp. M13]MCR8666373.1 sulfotransferase domain-containing protein [Aestuariibaculum sp. M13]